ncbi:large subunit ribosomal protein L46, partial [Tremellales sp. Uapishka_1]
MSFAPRSCRQCQITLSSSSKRFLSTPSTSSATLPNLKVSLLLSRSPLLTKTPTPLESAYYAHSTALRLSLSNPIPAQFYFKAGSLPSRRFQLLQHARDLATFGERLAGAAPEVGEIQMEPELTVNPRNKWMKEDAERKEKSLERYPEDEVFLMVQNTHRGKWGFPESGVEKGEGLDEAVKRDIIGVDGVLNGKQMDSWLITRKPIGLIKSGESRNFFLKSHILAGEPDLSKSSLYSTWAWLTPAEIEEKLKSQGDQAVWESIRGFFGISH